MAVPYIDVKGTVPRVDAGLSAGGVATVGFTDSLTNYTITFQAANQTVPVGTCSANQVLVGSGTNTHATSTNFTFDGTTLYANAKLNLGAVSNASPASGDYWYDTTQKTFAARTAGATAFNSGILYVGTATVTVANSTTETSMLGTGVGSATLPANFAVVGRTIRVRSHGFISDTATPSSTIKIKLGAVTLVTSTGTLPSGLSNAEVTFEFVFTFRSIGSSGTVIGQGISRITSGAFVSSASRALVMTAPATIDTTVANAMDVTYQWGTASASNTISMTNSIIEVIA